MRFRIRRLQKDTEDGYAETKEVSVERKNVG